MINLAGSLLAAYARLVWRTSRFEIEGQDELRTAAKEHGAVILAIWHQRSVMSPYLAGLGPGEFCALTGHRAPARIAGAAHERFGWLTVPMPKSGPSFGAVRQVTRMMRNGVSIAIAVDGTGGPARQAKSFPIQWARVTGVPIFIATYSVRGFRLLNTWDRLVVPRPFTKGVIICRRWDAEIPNRLSDAETEELRRQLDKDLDALTEEADLRSGHAKAIVR